MEKRLPLPTSRLFAFSLASTFFCTLSIFGLILLATGGLAQSAEDMPLRQVISSAQSKIGEGDFAGAAPYLDELEARFEGEKDPAIAKILQQFGFVRGVGYLQSFAKTGKQSFLGRAAAAFAFFAEKFPNDTKAVMAIAINTSKSVKPSAGFLTITLIRKVALSVCL